MAKKPNKKRPPRPKKDKMPRAEFVDMVRYLAEKRGVNPSDIIKAIGNNANNREREQVGDALKTWLKDKK